MPQLRDKLKITPMLGVLYALWAFILFDIQFFLAAKGIPVLLQVPPLLFALVFAMALFSGRTDRWVPLLLGFAGIAAATVPLADNELMAWINTKRMLFYYIAVMGTVQFIRTPAQVLPLLTAFCLSYLWWAFHSKTMGLVRWHPTAGNFDSYGSMMVVGIGFCYYYGTATKHKYMKLLGLGLAGFCVMGVVASFARGAVISLGFVLLLMWFRSPHKKWMTVGLAVGVAAVMMSSKILYEEGEFWDEMGSSFTEGTEEGTGNDRWEMWKASVNVFKTSPIWGVGSQNFGVVAARIHAEGEVGSSYADPMRLYTRHLHNIYFQILSEFGLIGSVLFLAILLDFHRRNVATRTKFTKAWASDPKRPDLVALTYGLEASMAGYMAVAFFYNLLYVHFLYTLLALNLALHYAAKNWHKKWTAAQAVQVTAGPIPALITPTRRTRGGLG